MKSRIIIFIFLFALFISCEKEVFVESEKDETYPTGKLVIESLPGPASIYIDEKNSGFKTGDTIKYLLPGIHKITLKQNLLKDTVFNINIVENSISKILIDYYKNPGQFGRIYCGSNKNGAVIFLDDQKTNFATPATISMVFPGEHKVKYVLPEHRSDSVKINVEGGKTVYVSLSLEDTSKWVSYTINNSSISANHLSSIVVDKNNVKWIGTRDQGLCFFDGKNWNIYKKENSPLIYDFINYLSVDNENNLWIATTGGLMKKSGKIWIDYTSNLPSTYVTSIEHDKNGNTWIGTSNGLVKFNGNSWVVMNTSNSAIPSNFITSITIDKLNRVWIGTSANGVGFFDGITWKNYNMSNMKLQRNLGNGIRFVKVDNNGIVWVSHIQNLIAGELGGLTTFDGNNWTEISLLGIPSNQVETIYIDSKNQKWIGTKNGFGYFLNSFSIKYFNTGNSPLTASQVVGISLDENEDLYVVTFGGGMCKIKKGNY